MRWRALCFLVALVPYLRAHDVFLFTSFRGNGESGVHFAISSDAKRWVAVNGDRPVVKPEFPGMLMRDPWIGKAPDGIWHMLWTCGWNRADKTADLTIGHTSSRDLLHWTKQVRLPVMRNEAGARNAWAPEAVWDVGRKEWIIFWASTIPGRFASTETTGDSGYNHRMYYMTTKDWNEFSPAKLFFDPGFNCIDATIVPTGQGWTMVFKDERRDPLQKRLRTAVASSPAGPWTQTSEPFTDQWVEGPTVLKAGRWWWIYFDHYTRPQHYGAMRTADWKHFEDETKAVSFPDEQRHGTAVRISTAAANRLKAANIP